MQLSAEMAMHGFRLVEAVWQPSQTEQYVVARAYGSQDGWYAAYFGPSGEVVIETVDEEDEPIWWPGAGEATAACRMHRERMERGDTATEAAAYVRVNADERGLELAAGEA